MISGHTQEIQSQRAHVVPLETKFPIVRAPHTEHTLVRPTVVTDLQPLGSQLVQII